MFRNLYDLYRTLLVSVTGIQQDHAFEWGRISSHVGKPPGGHDLRMDGGLPTGFQKGTLF